MKHTTTLSVPERLTQALFRFFGSWRNLLGGFIVVGLTIVSITFNLELAKQMSVDSDSERLLMAGYGMLDLASVFLAGYLGAQSRSIFRRFLARSLFLFLMALSLWAACSYALTIDATKENGALQRAIAAKKADLAVQNENVAIWQANLANTERHKTRFAERVTAEQEKARAIEAELTELETALPQPTMAIYDRVSPITGLSADELALLVRILWSVALVISPVLLLTFLVVEITALPASRTRTDTAQHIHVGRIRRALARIRRNQTNTPWSRLANTVRQLWRSRLNTDVRNSSSTDTPLLDNKTSTEPPKTEGVRDTGIRGDAGNRYEALRSAVLAGRIRPSNRHVQQFCSCGQVVANRYLSALEDEGIIARGNRGEYTINDTLVA